MSRTNVPGTDARAARERQLQLLKQHLQQTDGLEAALLDGAGSDQEEVEYGSGEEEDEEEEEDDCEPWIISLLQKRGNEFLCEVNPDFIVDGFNLTGLERMVRGPV
jgi:casein kinase II subunit beta